MSKKGMPIASLHNVSVCYGAGARAVWAVRDVSLDVAQGEFVSITGPSGSGKTTLLNVIAGLEPVTSGTVTVAGNDVGSLSDARLARMRRQTVSYIFQFFGLLPMLSAEQNVAVPLRADGLDPMEISDRVGRALAAVGMSNRASHHPDELSGGEMQRVAIARSLATDARLLLADEPTGNLDRVRSEEVLELLRWASDVDGRSVVLVTHDLVAAAYADRMISLRDGQIVEETKGDTGGAEIIRLRRD